MRAAPLLGLLLFACGSSDEGSSSSVASGATATVGAQCAADTRKDTYAAGMTKPAGNLTVKLVSSDPGPPQKDNNTLSLVVTDAAGAPVDGATVTVVPRMPDHGHGSAVTPTVTATGNGGYTAKNVYLAMAGLWELTVSVQRGPGDVQAAVFKFCLDG